MTRLPGLTLLVVLAALGAVVSGAAGREVKPCDDSYHSEAPSPELKLSTIVVQIDGDCYRENLFDICWRVPCPEPSSEGKKP